MFKQLFFDDQRLFARENARRIYGAPEYVGHYRDSLLNISYCWAYAIKGPDGKTHLLFQGLYRGQVAEGMSYGAAVSDDGIHFQPRNTASGSGIQNPDFPYQLFPTDAKGSEIAAVLEDPKAPPSERYKMLFTDNSRRDKDLHIIDTVLFSADLISWKEKCGCYWNPIGTEPLLGAFYNPVNDKFTILTRPDLTHRRVAITETPDWQYYSPMEICLQNDSLDKPLAEIYGMPAIEYDGWFIGFPHIYADFPQILNTKCDGGTMHVQLAYSLNGRHWQRALRTPFIDAGHPAIVENMGLPGKMTFLTSALRQDDGSILLYVITNMKEHGTPNAELQENDTCINILRLREDGFIGLQTEDKNIPARVATREIVWHGGEVTFNLVVSKATCAVYERTFYEVVPIPGFSHEDCTPASGDRVRWIPQWKGGNLEQFAGRILVFELRFENGTLYSVSGNGTPVMSMEGARYIKFGELPASKGF
ncbi:MAG: hypothetical protein GX946_06295 [Oligosphaeraceae bacterium]|nr:hypothetical protein [Oligosphaeraceae bacterium]